MGLNVISKSIGKGRAYITRVKGSCDKWSISSRDHKCLRGRYVGNEGHFNASTQGYMHGYDGCN